LRAPLPLEVSTPMSAVSVRRQVTVAGPGTGAPGVGTTVAPPLVTAQV
jgi:hypothetical protein